MMADPNAAKAIDDLRKEVNTLKSEMKEALDLIDALRDEISAIRRQVPDNR